MHYTALGFTSLPLCSAGRPIEINRDTREQRYCSKMLKSKKTVIQSGLGTVYQIQHDEKRVQWLYQPHLYCFFLTHRANLFHFKDWNMRWQDIFDFVYTWCKLLNNLHGAKKLSMLKVCVCVFFFFKAKQCQKFLIMFKQV